MNDQQVLTAVHSAVTLCRESKAKMVQRMLTLLDPLPGCARLLVAGHTITYATVYARCSQWGNLAYPVWGSARMYIIDGTTTLGVPDASYWDGHNQQEQFGPAYLSDRATVIRPARGSVLREISHDLHAALLAYAQTLTQSAEANAACASAL